jgi:hypothetical protein
MDVAGKTRNPVTGKCYLWLMSAPKNTEMVEMVFPITDLSFIPPDRILGNTAKEVSVWKSL